MLDFCLALDAQCLRIRVVVLSGGIYVENACSSAETREQDIDLVDEVLLFGPLPHTLHKLFQSCSMYFFGMCFL